MFMWCSVRFLSNIPIRFHVDSRQGLFFPYFALWELAAVDGKDRKMGRSMTDKVMIVAPGGSCEPAATLALLSF